MKERTVWHWQDLESWQTVIWGLVSDVLDKRVINAFRQSPPEYLVSDDLSWLDKIVKKATGERVSTSEMLASRLMLHYDAIRAFHGARPVNVESYYERGLEPLDAKAAEKVARSTFLSGNFPELTERHIDEAIRAVGTEVRDGRLYFEANEQWLVGYCAHYMLYGSEYLTGIAAQIDAPKDYRAIFLARGKPTVFVCDVPLNYMHSDAVEEFAGTALVCMFERLLYPETKHPKVGDGAGICLRRSLPPELIVSHYHPTLLKDPLTKKMVLIE